MGQYILKRIVYWIPALLLLALTVYALAFYGAGDPIKLKFLREEGDVTYDAQRLDAIRREKGLDRPFLVQFGEYTWHLLQGDLGMSVISGRSVNDMVGATAPVSFQIGIATVFLVAIFGIPLGIIAGLHHNEWLDNLILGSALFVKRHSQLCRRADADGFSCAGSGRHECALRVGRSLQQEGDPAHVCDGVLGSIAIIVRQTRSGCAGGAVGGLCAHGAAPKGCRSSW